MQEYMPARGLRTGKRKGPLQKMLGCWQLYLLLLPGFAYFVIFYYGPMYGLQIAFKDYMPGLGILGSPWVGLKHIERFVTSAQFIVVVRNTLYINLFYLLCRFPLPIVLALLLNECGSRRFKKLVQNVTYMPYFISTVVLVSMVINFLSPSIGVVNRCIEFLGGAAQDFMIKPEWFRPIYILSGLWQNTGVDSIIYLAALAAVDPNQHEAAQIDGASRLRRIWHINLPGIMPAMVILFILRCGEIMNVGFEKAFLMQNALNMSASEVISTYVYKSGLLGSQYSYSTVVGLFNSVINFTLILAVNAAAKRVGETSLW
jgi:putative aldouronate transport system permease protein